jgi:hypothetical protein
MPANATPAADQGRRRQGDSVMIDPRPAPPSRKAFPELPWKFVEDTIFHRFPHATRLLRCRALHIATGAGSRRRVADPFPVDESHDKT